MENQELSLRRLRGFAAMTKERQREIASHGGQTAHEKGTAHVFNSIEAMLAAKKGHSYGTAHEFTTEEARAAGRKGGLARAMNRARVVEQSTASAGEAIIAFAEPPKE